MMISRSKKHMQYAVYAVFFLMAMAITVTTGCIKDDDDDPDPDPTLPQLDAQVRVQVAYDATDVAFKFVWKSQAKTLPDGQPNTGKKYPGMHHDFLVHNGTAFDRLGSAVRVQEDRISFFIDKYEGGIPGFSKATCAATCHTGMARHHLLSDNIIDHWHWRGGRSGPFGFAEDAAANNVERIRDDLGTSPTKFIRSGGDRLREDQAALNGMGHPVLENGLPRFVFNKGKVMPGNFTIPAYFIADQSGNVATDPYAVASSVKEVDKNRFTLVIHQDKSFDNEEKVNAIDLAYLAFVASSSVDHLPAHLQDEGTADFTYWTTYWANETGIAVDAAAQATAKLDEVYTEWTTSGNKAMITRSVGFIYESGQHDIKSTHSWDDTRKEWTVIMYRKLSTGSDRDADLGGLPNGTKFAFSFAMHDLGAAGISHQISMPYVVSNSEDDEIQAKMVPSVANVNWDQIPWFDTYYVKDEYVLDWKWSEDWLRGGSHPGGGVFETSTCKSCHQNNLTYNVVRN